MTVYFCAIGYKIYDITKEIKDFEVSKLNSIFMLFTVDITIYVRILIGAMTANNTISSPSREKFVTLSNKRVGNAAKYISILGNLSNRSSYLYDENDAKKIFKYLKNVLRETEAKFSNNNLKNENTFNLIN